jgi:hypothetical protein
MALTVCCTIAELVWWGRLLSALPVNHASAGLAAATPVQALRHSCNTCTWYSALQLHLYRPLGIQLAVPCET